MDDIAAAVAITLARFRASGPLQGTAITHGITSGVNRNTEQGDRGFGDSMRISRRSERARCAKSNGDPGAIRAPFGLG
jgi:hypothetical protein